MVRGVLATFETVVMYGHFDESRAAWYRQIVEIKPKFPVFAQGVKKWRYVNLNHYIRYIMLVLFSVYNGGGLMDGGLLVA